MLALPMMTALPDDVASLMFIGKHRIIATEGSNIIMRSITSYRPRRCIVEISWIL